MGDRAELGMYRQAQEIKELKKQIDELVKCVEFYGHDGNWCTWDVSRKDNESYQLTIADDEEYVDEVIKTHRGKKYVSHRGGKRARQCLEKHNSISTTEGCDK